MTQRPVPRRTKSGESRFRVLPFTNRRTGKQSFRVTGFDREGRRVRENFTDVAAAKARSVELELEFLGNRPEAALRHTTLTDGQLRFCETALARLGDPRELLPAVEAWIATGREKAASAPVDAPRLCEAVGLFVDWLEQPAAPGKRTLRPRTVESLRAHLQKFAARTQNLPLPDIRPSHVEAFVDDGYPSQQTRLNRKFAISRFFRWAAQRERRWAAGNPAAAVEIQREQSEETPQIFSVEQCERLLRAAEAFQGGRVLPFVAVCLFAGLRPAEAARLTWDCVCLADRKLTVEAQASKRRKKRVVTICDSLAAWLCLCESKPFRVPPKQFTAFKAQAGFGPGGDPWIHDGMRHTGVSHFLTRSGSFGETARQFGNSEGIIKNHYDGNASKDETRRFYQIEPTTTNT